MGRLSTELDDQASWLRSIEDMGTVSLDWLLGDMVPFSLKLQRRACIGCCFTINL